MLLLASYEDNKVLVKNQIAEVKRGQFVGSLSFFAKRWGVSRDRVSSFLKLLESDGMIIRTLSGHIQQITICNYESYQDVPDSFPTDSQQNVYSLPTDGLPTKEIKEIQEYNNINNNNARTREERVSWQWERENGFGEQIKATHMMAIGRKFSLNRNQVLQYVQAFLDKCQIGDHGHRDIGHFGNHLNNFIDEEEKKPKPVEAPRQRKVITNQDTYKLMQEMGWQD